MGHLAALMTASIGFSDAANHFDSVGRDPRHELAELRRTQLKLHQTLGLSTLGAMAITGGVGRVLTYLRVYQGQSAAVTNPLQSAHFVLAMTTGTLYLTTASLALAAPARLVEPPDPGIDSIWVHKGLAVLHATGIAATLGLGLAAARVDPAFRPLHDWVGFTTFVILGASATVIALDF